jgi:hypothetical protein
MLRLFVYICISLLKLILSFKKNILRYEVFLSDHG